MGRSRLLALSNANRARTLVAFGVVLTAAIVAVAAQPVGSPWWIYADADATYTASGIELAAGEHSFYLDHPGVPLQDLMAITVATRYALHRLAGADTSPHAYAAERLLNLDGERPYFRGWAIAFFLSGALIAFFALWRLLGSPVWGATGALLWLAAPDLTAMSIQFRPDALLAGLVLACGYLILRGAERRDAWTYTLAAFLLGLTLMVKLHAAGLLVPFALALLWRPPEPGWRPELATALRRSLRRYRIPLLLFAVTWAAFCVAFNRSRVPFTLTHEQSVTLVELGAAFGDYLLVVLVLSRTKLPRGPFTPFGAVLVSAFALGILLPGTLFLDDLPEMLVKVVGGLTGGQVNEGITPFSTPLSSLLHGPLVYTLIMVGIAGIAAALGAIRRDPFPILWFSGALATGVMALARLGTIHYFEPAFVLAIPAALWLARALPQPARLAAGASLLGVMLFPAFTHLPDAAASADRQQHASRVYERLAQRLLTSPGDVALADSYASPVPDTRWFGLVHQYVAWSPAYPFRFLPADSALSTAQAAHLRPTYFIGALPLSLNQQQQVTVGFGTYDLEPLPSTFDPGNGVGAARLVRGPGVDLPLAP